MLSSELDHSGDQPPQWVHNDIMSSMRKGGRRFFLLFGAFITGTCWYLAGAQTSLALFVGAIPPRFVKCDDPSCDPNQIITDPCDTTTPYVYKWPGLSVVSTFDVSQCNPILNSSLALMLLFAGIFTGAVLIAPVSDHRGRRPIITLGLLGILAATVFSVTTKTYWGYCVSRFIIGMSMSSVTLPSSALLSEITPIDSRHVGIILQSGGFILAGCVVAALAYVIPDWKILTLVSVLPIYSVLIAAMPLGLCIESPKWQAARGKHSQAYETWIKIAKICESEFTMDVDTFTKYDLQSMRSTKLLTPEDVDEELAIMSAQQIVKPDSLKKAIQTFPTSIWIYISLYLWVITSFVYYGILLDFNQIITSDHTRILLAHKPARFLQEPSLAEVENETGENFTQEFLPMQQTAAGIFGEHLISGNKDIEKVEILGAAGVDEFMEPDHIIDPVESAERNSKIENEADRMVWLEQVQNFLRNDLGTLVRNSSESLIDSAERFPEEASKFYDEWQFENRIQDWKDQVKSETSESDAMAPFWIAKKDNVIVTFISFALEGPSYVLVMWLAARPWLGRKRTSTLMYCLGSCFLFAAAICHMLNFPMKVGLYVAVIGRCWIAAQFMLLYLFTAEMFPTSIRASILGLFSAAARIGGISAAPVAAALDQQFPGLMLIVASLLCVIAAVSTVSTLPETLGEPLNDTLDTLERAHHEAGFYDKFMDSRINRFFRNVLCPIPCISKCLGLNSFHDQAPQSFEDKGFAWLRRHWQRSSGYERQHDKQ